MKIPDDPDATVTAALAGLPVFDVSPHRAERLRSKCHAVLMSDPARSPSSMTSTLWDRLLFGAASGWGGLYLFEIIRHSAAAYRP